MVLDIVFHHVVVVVVGTQVGLEGIGVDFKNDVHKTTIASAEGERGVDVIAVQTETRVTLALGHLHVSPHGVAVDTDAAMHGETPGKVSFDVAAGALEEGGSADDVAKVRRHALRRVLLEMLP